MTTSDGTIQGTTRIVDNGPPSERFNVVFMGDGYQTTQMTQYANDVQRVVDTMFLTPPFDELRRAINVYRVDVTSTDSGADDPTTCGGSGATARTYFDATFCGDGVNQRLLVVNNTTALNTAGAQVPQWHTVLVVVNTTVYGGAGGAVGTFSLAPGAEEIALHEMGHTAFDLADEYEYWRGCASGETDRNNHPASEPAEVNVTINTDRATLKWRHLVAAATAIPTTNNANCAQCDPQASPVVAGTVGLFEGAHYYHCDAFRPEFTCKMRALNNPFCAVCQERIRAVLGPFLILAGTGEFYTTDGAGNISLLKNHTGWRQSWTHIIPGDFGGSGRTDLLFYEQSTGTGEFYTTDGAGNISLLKNHTGWRQSWTHIIPGDFGGSGRTDLLFYEPGV